MSLLEELTQKKDFTQAEAVIADFILENADEVSTLGITDLARRTYSSNATIIRMCRKLGITGYKEFRLAFVSDLEKERRDRPDVDVNYPFSETESAASIMRSVANISTAAIEDRYAALPQSALIQAARVLRAAEHIYICGAGDSYITAMGFANMLQKIGHITVFPSQYLEGPQRVSSATRRDAALIVTYSGHIISQMKLDLRVLRRNRTPVIVISALKDCPAADLLVPIPNRENVVGKAAGYYSQTTLRYVLNCLYGLIYSLDLEKNKEYKDNADAYAYGRDGK